MKTSILLFTVFASQAFGHFGLTYPAWRIDTLAETNESISQWTYPCANVQSGQNTSQGRTPWPLGGGSIVLDLHHKWTYLFVNLGFGNDVSNFNVSLNPNGGALVNETGNGTFCWNRLPVPPAAILGLEVRDGQNATIQVVTVGDKGSALYNCADIVFSSNATVLPADRCMNSTGIEAKSVSSNATSPEGSQNRNTTTSSSGSSSMAFAVRPGSILAWSVVGCALILL